MHEVKNTTSVTYFGNYMSRLWYSYNMYKYVSLENYELFLIFLVKPFYQYLGGPLFLNSRRQPHSKMN